MKIVGWGSTDIDPVLDYWTVQNSWGPAWGMGGCVVVSSAQAVLCVLERRAVCGGVAASARGCLCQARLGMVAWLRGGEVSLRMHGCVENAGAR